MTAIYKSAEGQKLVEEAYAALLTRWPVPNTQKHVPTREGETFILSCGPESAPPLMLFHGAMANSAVWMFDAALWSQHFRVHCVDVIGDANFSAPSRPPLNSDAHALWLDDVMAALALPRTAMLGGSLGGWLALDYATRRPECVDKLVLLAPAGVGAQKNFLLRALPLLLLGPWGARKMREMVFGPAPDEIPAALRPFRDFMALLHAHTRPRPVKIPIVPDEALARLTMPVLTILGGKDVMLDSFGTRQRLQAQIPHAEILFFPEGRHVITGLTGRITDFLRGVQGAAFKE